MPPLHRIELSNPKKGMDKYVYTYSDDELQRKLAELSKKSVRWKDPVQRYKGLGEMDADQLAETTMDPRHRTLRRITIDDADAAEQVFELLMGNDVAPRKEFIVQGAYELDLEAHRRLAAATRGVDLSYAGWTSSKHRTVRARWHFADVRRVNRGLHFRRSTAG